MPTAGAQHAAAAQAAGAATQVAEHSAEVPIGVDSHVVRLGCAECEEDLVRVAEGLVEGWPVGQAVTITVISGGTTNLLYKLEAQDTVALVRVFGEGSDLLIDRGRDNKVAEALAEAGVGPQYLGHFANGRVEGWLDAKPITPPEAFAQADVQAAVAAELAKVHLLPLCTAPGDPHVVLWEQVTGWLAQTTAVLSDAAQDEVKAAQFAGVDLPWMQRIAEVLKAELQAGPTQAAGATAAQQAGTAAAWELFTGTVFCHNDVNSGNVLVPPEGGAVHFIDFEYAGANPAGFDIGNHWCEYAGFDFDQGLHHYPSSAVATAFLQAYVAARCPDVLAGLGEEGSEAFWAEGVRVCNGFALASHLLWAAWSMVQGAFSTVQFDFVGYGQQRLGALVRQRRDFGLPPIPLLAEAAGAGGGGTGPTPHH